MWHVYDTLVDMNLEWLYGMVWMVWESWILWIHVWFVILYSWIYLSFPMFLFRSFMDYDDVMLTLSGLWWTAYLSVWTGRRRAGCLVVACWCRGVEFLFFMQVSRLGLWSRIVLACCFILTMYLEVVDIFCYLGFGEYNCILLRSGDVLWFLSMSAAMLCNMIFMHVCIVVYSEM